MKLYLYTGLGEPELLAESVRGLKKKLQHGLTLSDTYTGVANDEVVEVLKSENGNDLLDDLTFYSIYARVKDMQQANLAWGLSKYTYLEKLL